MYVPSGFGYPCWWSGVSIFRKGFENEQIMKTFLHRRPSTGSEACRPPVSDKGAAVAGRPAPRCIPAFSSGAAAIGALAIGALSIGAIAFGAVAIARLVIGRLSVKKARIGTLEVGELKVGKLDVAERDGGDTATLRSGEL